MDWSALIPILVVQAVTLVIARETIKSQVNKALPSWKKLYENDNFGNKVSGDIEKLIEAVGNGYPIRVKIIKEKDTFEIFDAEWVFVKDGNVIAQNSSQFSMGADGKFFKEPYHFAVSAITDGRHHAG